MPPAEDRAPQTNPMRAAQAKSRPELPRRFYKHASHAPASDSFALHLDGKPARTPGRAPLVAPSERVAAALAAEWNAQTDVIDPRTMPLTRIVNAAIDGVAARIAEVRADIVAYAGTDLICYRAETPPQLVARQEAAWTPLVAWAGKELEARLVVATGIRHVAQDPAALAAIGRALAACDSFGLAALHTITTLTGSAILALAVARGRLTPADAWTAAHIDEDWQIERWGEDSEAAARRAARRRDLEGAALILLAAP